MYLADRVRQPEDRRTTRRGRFRSTGDDDRRVVPGGVLKLDVAYQQLAAECFGERDAGGVVGTEVVPQFPHPGVVRPDGLEAAA